MGFPARFTPAVGGTLMIIAFIFYVCSNALPMWGKLDDRFRKLEIGLWRGCISNGNGRVCGKVTGCELLNVCGKLDAARAFVTLACLLSGFTVLILVAQVLLRDSARKIVAFMSIIFSALSFIAGIIGVGVGGALFMNDFHAKLAAAAVLGIIAVIINFVGFVAAGLSLWMAF